jgi:hypothetical protein
VKTGKDCIIIIIIIITATTTTTTTTTTTYLLQTSFHSVAIVLTLLLLLQSALQPLVGFRPAQLSLSILSRKVLQSAVASGTSNPNLEEKFLH